MIKYQLKCSDGHEFEAWFASSTAYETLECEGRLVCAHCASTDVKRAVMAPRIASRPAKPPAHHAAIPVSHAPATSALPPAGSADAERLHALMREVRTVRDKILEKSEYVGPRFAEEARRIHFDEAPDRAIHGEATTDEARELADEGIDVMPIPRLPDDLN